MKRILKEANLDPKKWEPKGLLNAISNAKNDLLDESAYEAQTSARHPYEMVVARVIRFTKKNYEKQNQWILTI